MQVGMFFTLPICMKLSQKTYPRFFLPIHHDRNLHNTAALRQQCLHDTCLVRPSEAPADEYLHIMAPHRRHRLLMVHRLLRILPHGTRQQSRLHRKRRTLHTDAAESDTGSHILDRVHSHCRIPVSGRRAPLEPYRSLPLPHPRSILRILGIAQIMGNMCMTISSIVMHIFC